MKRKIDLEHLKSLKKLRWTFVLTVAIVLILAISISILLEFLLISTNVITSDMIKNSLFLVGVIFGGTSIITGTILFLFAYKIVFNPINELLNGMNNLSKGKYDTRIDVKAFPQVTNSFNSLAKELQNVQILRQDFINNFSHEFKTPIVSIKGLISLMKNKKISKEKEKEYLDIIDEEINRLSLITTNVLNQSKLENQEILTEYEPFNVSEQVRRSVLLFERQWTSKNLTLKMDFDEFIVNGNEDMLKQVWVNLIDNAIKFAYNDTELDINVENVDNEILISVGNVGVPILDEQKEKIFNKFYQADESYSKTGNGIGLSIVKKIVELHKGKVFVENKNDKTIFTVKLPC